MYRSSRTLLAAALVAALLGDVAMAKPEVTGLTCSPGIADARKTDVVVTCALRVVDKESDIDFAYTRLVSPSGKFSLPLLFDGKKSFGLTSFTGANLAATATIPRHAEPGNWQVRGGPSDAWGVCVCGANATSSIPHIPTPHHTHTPTLRTPQVDFSTGEGLKVVNKKGSTTTVSAAGAKELGLSRFIKIYSPDDKAPAYIRDVACASPVVLNNTRVDGATVECKFTVMDSGSGPATVRASFVSPEGDALLHMTADVIKDVVSSSAATGEVVLSASVPVFAGMPAGLWTMVTSMPLAPYVTDRNLNGFSYEGVDTATVWSKPSFEVFSNPDTTPPVVQKFGCSATQVIVPWSGEDIYSCQLVVQDDMSGFAYGELVFENPDRNATATLRFDANTRQVQFARGGIYAPTLSFDPTAPGGMWTVSREGLQLWDLAGNVISYNPKELNDRSFPTFLLVSKTDTPPPIDPVSPASALKVSYSVLVASFVALLLMQRR